VAKKNLDSTENSSNYRVAMLASLKILAHAKN
jgi:hypothetical protein